MPLDTPAGYYNRQLAHPEWKQVLARHGWPLQSAEVNEMQTLLISELEKCMKTLYKDGSVLSGGDISTQTNVDDNNITVNIAAADVFAYGYVHQIGAGSVVITGSGTEVIGLLITNHVIDENAEPDLLDPAIGAENYGSPGAHRLSFNYQYVLNNASAVPIATFIDGQLVKNVNNNSFMQQILDLLAQRTFEQSGHFVVEPPILEVVDVGTKASNPTVMRLNVKNGIAYPKGYRVFSNGNTSLGLSRPLSGVLRQVEPFTYLTGTKKYTLDNKPILSASRLSGVLQSPTITMTRGGVVNGQDAIPSQYQPVAIIVSAAQGGTTYVQGTDYALAGNNIQWLAGGAQPATGSSYNLVVQYEKILTKGVRTMTHVTDEVQTVSGGSFTLSHPELVDLIYVKKSDNSVTYAQGTNFTYNARTGVFTVVGGTIANGTSLHITYDYWAHTVEGDYLCRDSFVDNSGNTLLYLSPTYLPSADTPAVNYQTDIVFDTTSGITPVNNTTALIDYTFAIGRIDVMIWRPDGIMQIIEGEPSLAPQAPAPPATAVPVAKIHMPPEAFAADCTIELYNNRTLLVTELRNMLTQLINLQYNDAVFQLHQQTAGKITPTEIRGIFADDFATADLADTAHTDWAATFDFLSRSVHLPRTGSAQNISSSMAGTDCALHEDVWMPTFTERTDLSQNFSSETALINEFGMVNTTAKITFDPGVLLFVDQETVSIKSNTGATTLPSASVKNDMLLANASLNTWAAGQQGAGTPVTNAMLDQITPEPGWVSVSSNSNGVATGVVTNNQWGTILATSRVFATSTGLPLAQTVKITGSRFLPNERAIMALFDNQVVHLAATGTTTQETDPKYPDCVVADGAGNFTANMTVPAGTKNGTYSVAVVGRDPLDFSRITSIAGNTLTIGSYIRQVALQIYAHLDQVIVFAYPWGYTGGDVVIAYAHLLNIGQPTTQLTSTGYNWSVYTIAQGVADAVNLGVTLSHSAVVAALKVMFDYCRSFNPKPTADQLDAVVNAMQSVTGHATLDSSNVQAMVNAMLQLPYWWLRVPIYHGLELDPIAETFTVGTDSFVTSIDLFFNTQPNQQVTVALVSTEAGIPTKNYLGMAFRDGSSIVTGQNTATKFTFAKPVFLRANTTYAFVVMCEDPTASVWISRLGGVDPVNGLIQKQPFAGVMLKSANGETWTPDQSADIKFNVNVAQFTKTTATINFGAITLPQASCLFAFYCPFILPSNDASVQYQYSTDGSTWIDFQPLKEVDLGGLFSTLYLRVILRGTDSIAPVVQNSAALKSFVWLSAGAYVHRQFSLPSAEVRYVDLWVEVDLKGSTTITPRVQLDGGAWHNMTYVPADDVPIDDVYVERHYTYDTTGPLFTNVRTEVQMTTSAAHITPGLKAYKVAAR